MVCDSSGYFPVLPEICLPLNVEGAVNADMNLFPVQNTFETEEKNMTNVSWEERRNTIVEIFCLKWAQSGVLDMPHFIAISVPCVAVFENKYFFYRILQTSMNPKCPITAKLWGCDLLPSPPKERKPFMKYYWS